MAFNIVDQNDNHRGLVLGRYSVDKDIIRTKSGVLWLVGLTNYRIEDMGWGIHQIERHWAEQWKLKTNYGMNNTNFTERIKRMAIAHKKGGLNYEETLRFVHTWHSWKKMRLEIESKIPINGYIFVDPLESNYRDNRIIVEMPEIFPDTIKSELGIPVFVKIIDPPTLKVSSFNHENVKIYSYSTAFNAYSGNTNFQLTLPFAVNNARKDHFMQLFFNDTELNTVYVNGLFYELEQKKWSLFGN